MQTTSRIGGPRGGDDFVGCEELGRMDFVDTSGCCERCHSAERHVRDDFRGPCRVALPDGREAFVCCAARRQLLGGKIF